MNNDADIDVEGYRAATKAYDKDIVVTVGADDFDAEGVAATVDIFGLITGRIGAFNVLRTRKNKRTRRTEMVTTRKNQSPSNSRLASFISFKMFSISGV